MFSLRDKPEFILSSPFRSLLQRGLATVSNIPYSHIWDSGGAELVAVLLQMAGMPWDRAAFRANYSFLSKAVEERPDSVTASSGFGVIHVGLPLSRSGTIPNVIRYIRISIVSLKASLVHSCIHRLAQDFLTYYVG